VIQSFIKLGLTRLFLVRKPCKRHSITDEVKLPCHITQFTSIIFCHPELLEGIDELNDFIYPSINNGVYRAGFASTQPAYNEALVDLFNALDSTENR
jgi:hypothetical protein